MEGTKTRTTGRRVRAAVGLLAALAAVVPGSAAAFEAESLNGSRTTSLTPRGVKRAPHTAARAAALLGWRRRDGVRPQPALSEQQDLQLPSASTSSPSATSANGGGCGASSSTTPSVARSPAAKKRRSPSTRATRWRNSATRSDRSRSPATPSRPGRGPAPGNPRQQVNTVNSYIDGWALYGARQQRLEWMRTGPDNGNPAKAGARLLLPQEATCRSPARGDAATGAPDGHRRRPRREPRRTRSSPATCGPTRTSS